MKKIVSAALAVVSFLAGVLVIFTRKSKAPYKTALTLEINEEQYREMFYNGGAIVFKDINVQGQVGVQLKRTEVETA